MVEIAVLVVFRSDIIVPLPDWRPIKAVRATSALPDVALIIATGL